MAEHLSEEDGYGYAQRALFNSNGNQDNSVGASPAVVPANGENYAPASIARGSKEFLHAQPYGAAVTDSGAADCEQGQRGYVIGRNTTLQGRPLQHRDLAAHARRPGPDVHRPAARAQGRDVHARAERQRRHRDRADQAVKRGRKKRGMTDFAAGAIALAVIVVVVYLGFTKSIPFQPHYTIRAAVHSANNINKNSFVRIAGVNVGKVTGIEHPPGGGSSAIITMQIDDKGLPIHKDATIAIRPRIFLEGNFFVDLHPGSPSAPTMKKNDTLPIQQSSAPVQLDQVLSSLNGNVRTDLQKLLVEYGRGVNEGAAGFNRSQKYWKDAYEYSALLNQASLGKHPHDLSKYIDRGGVVADALDKHPVQLKSLITDFNTTSHAFARVDTSLSAAIAELPRTLAVGRPALGALNAALPSLRRLSDELRPAVRSTGPMIDASLPFIRQLRGLVQPAELRGLVADLRPTVPDLAQLQTRSQPLYEKVRAASSCQNNVILPWTHDKIEDKQFPAKGEVYYESVKFLPGIAEESTAGDANGQWFRVVGGGGTQSYALGAGLFGNSLNPIQGENPPKPQSRPPIRPNTPCENQQKPDLRTGADAPPPLLSSNPIPSLPLPLRKKAQARLETSRMALLRQAQKWGKSKGMKLKIQKKPATKAQVQGLSKR